MRRFIVGDIHGQYDMLKALLDDVGFNPAEGDILYGLGDFCDRGEQNLEVLRYLMSLRNSFKSVFGNHDIWIWQYLHEPIPYGKTSIPYMSRDAEDCWMWNGGKTTRYDIHSIEDTEKRAIFNWIGRLPYRIELDDFIIVHTPSLKPVMGKDIDQTTLTLAKTMEKNLCEKDYDSWFWDRDIIAYSSVFSGRGTNLMTEDNKDSWGLGKKTFIIGHTPLTQGPLYDPYLRMIALDTGAFVRKEIHKVEGKLTILNLDTMEYNQVDGNLNKFNGKIELV